MAGGETAICAWRGLLRCVAVVVVVVVVVAAAGGEDPTHGDNDDDEEYGEVVPAGPL